uniref:Uncharacterized protein n=2 Tax=Pseudictyota dubia TaxID=2749911 RepID=A0A7R9Z3Q9_9STRA|mmetsp:Transcript_21184/g.39615  ORF Transcript_21184/g.39615 Transcript_21184/m.39615 type:complete len:264 (+) Transcript_21184:64-855(+)
MLARTAFFVFALAVLFLCAWLFSLRNLLEVHFWDPVYALDRMHEDPQGAMASVGASYYTKRRYFAFLPHVIAAILWWNLYFLQLVKPIRRKYPVFHRYLGRFLMCVAICQTVTGSALACTSRSSTIKLVSFLTAGSSFYCVVQAWWYARAKDFTRHKYWAQRLVGYMSTIALQRFWVVTLIVTHELGWNFLYPPLDGKEDEDVDRIIFKLFDDSFVLAMITALLGTEWYLAAEQGMMNAPDPISREGGQCLSGSPSEKTPLVV